MQDERQEKRSPNNADRCPDPSNPRRPKGKISFEAQMFASPQFQRVPEVILETQVSLSSFLSTGLALGLTYCKTANLTRSPEKREHLLTLAHEALTTAESYMELTPIETQSELREAARQLRCEIDQMVLNS